MIYLSSPNTYSILIQFKCSMTYTFARQCTYLHILLKYSPLQKKKKKKKQIKLQKQQIKQQEEKLTFCFYFGWPVLVSAYRVTFFFILFRVVILNDDKTFIHFVKMSILRTRPQTYPRIICIRIRDQFFKNLLHKTEYLLACWNYRNNPVIEIWNPGLKILSSRIPHPINDFRQLCVWNLWIVCMRLVSFFVFKIKSSRFVSETDSS